jgi:hypothetical protein
VTTPQALRKRWKIAVAVVVVFAVMGWMVGLPAYQRHQAIQGIERAGGEIHREDRTSSWFARLIRLNWRGQIVGVTFFRAGKKYNSRGLQHIPSLPTIEWVILNDSLSNGEGLEYLNDTDVKTLQIGDSLIDDNGLKHARGLKGLEALLLDDTEITDDGLAHLSGLTNLVSLSLDWTKISNDGLEHLTSLTNLRSLSLTGTRISDDGLKHLRGLTNLTRLTLVDTNVSDDGVEKLQESLRSCTILH